MPRTMPFPWGAWVFSHDLLRLPHWHLPSLRYLSLHRLKEETLIQPGHKETSGLHLSGEMGAACGLLVLLPCGIGVTR